MKYTIVGGIVVSAIFIVIAYQTGVADGTDYGADLVLNSPLPRYWHCMDGCYNMLEVIYGEVRYEDTALKEFHSACSAVCAEQGGVDEYYERIARETAKELGIQ